MIIEVAVWRKGGRGERTDASGVAIKHNPGFTKSGLYTETGFMGGRKT